MALVRTRWGWTIGLLVSAGGGCNGPISDLPRADDGEFGSPNAGFGDQQPSRIPHGDASATALPMPPPPPPLSGIVGLAAPRGDMPGGAPGEGFTATPSPPRAEALDAAVAFDAGLSDAGESDSSIFPEGDGSVDALLETVCVSAGGAHQGEACREAQCQMAFLTLSGDAHDPRCTAPDARSLACAGTLSRRAARCAELSTLAWSFETELRACLRDDALLAAASSDCIDCYADELLCALSSCLAACFEQSASCLECRARECGAAFTACSGAPTLGL